MSAVSAMIVERFAADRAKLQALRGPAREFVPAPTVEALIERVRHDLTTYGHLDLRDVRALLSVIEPAAASAGDHSKDGPPASADDAVARRREKARVRRRLWRQKRRADPEWRRRENESRRQRWHRQREREQQQLGAAS